MSLSQEGKMTTCYQSYSKAVSMIHWHIFNVVTYWHHISEVPSMRRHMLFFIFHSSKIFTIFRFSISDKIVFFQSSQEMLDLFCNAFNFLLFLSFFFFLAQVSFTFLYQLVSCCVILTRIFNRTSYASP